jgi:hypothetical protein
LRQIDSALDLFERVVDGGFSCYPAMSSDPWLDPLRKTLRFAKLLGKAEEQYGVADREFARLGGHRILGLAFQTGK